ncbi:MAG: aldehyde ferredoxin oxidoreductase family protein [Dehalococcoidia bacterium]|nr:aldehyde ferredoxin oxidoreductase family protein [Dehalococcoidia bacterium]MDZ4246754.1 aldehyde ferredoxin oxidoreductase family protein [Dehalococcoidia bacterium]
MFGWMGSVLEIDLSSGKIIKNSLDVSFARKWLGGEGFGSKYLWDHVGPEIKDGLDPGNVLIYTAGPLTGTLAPSSGRLEIVTKSPITGIFGDTNSGGHFAPEFKRAGYDAIIIKGQAEKPVYIWINDDEVEIRDARHLWGKLVSETDQAVKRELGDNDIQISCIGPAGENKVRFAILMNNLERAPGWVGCGAVAGSKNLKAVAVRGTKSISIARPEEFERACWETRQKVKKLRHLQTRRKMGTLYLTDLFYHGGCAHVNNFNITQCSPSYYEQIKGEKGGEYFTSVNGCHGCEVHCGHHYAIKQGPYAGLQAGGFEFGVSQAFNMWYGSSNLEFAMVASHFCNENGMDGSEPGMLLAWATDLFKKGLITEKDTDGLVLDWGDEKVALELLPRIVHRRGFGSLLGEGLYRAAKTLGDECVKYAYTIKKRASVEANARTWYGCALASATSTRGADHLKGWPFPELAGLPPEQSKKLWGNTNTSNPLKHEGKTEMTLYEQAMFTIIDSLGMCKFHSRPPLDGLNEEDYARLVSAATGVDFSGEDLIHTAHRIYNLQQAYNVREGLSRKDDSIPEHYFNEALNTGPLKGFILSRENFNDMLDDYYQARGWDKETAVPTAETLSKYDLGEISRELENIKRN